LVVVYTRAVSNILSSSKSTSRFKLVLLSSSKPHTLVPGAKTTKPLNNSWYFQLFRNSQFNLTQILKSKRIALKIITKILILFMLTDTRRIKVLATHKKGHCCPIYNLVIFYLMPKLYTIFHVKIFRLINNILNYCSYLL
jgi:hypothetical protein